MLTSLKYQSGTVLSGWGAAVSPSQAAEALRLSPGSYSEAYLRTLIAAAAQDFEARTGWSVNRAHYEALYDSWPEGRILTLPKYPASVVASIAFKRPGFTTHMWEVLPKLGQGVDLGWEPVFVTLPNEGHSAGVTHMSVRLPPLSALPPLLEDGTAGVVKVDFQTWDSNGLSASIRAVLFMMISDLYDGRDTPNPAVESLIIQHRRSGFIA